MSLPPLENIIIFIDLGLTPKKRITAIVIVPGLTLVCRRFVTTITVNNLSSGTLTSFLSMIFFNSNGNNLKFLTLYLHHTKFSRNTKSAPQLSILLNKE